MIPCFALYSPMQIYWRGLFSTPGVAILSGTRLSSCSAIIARSGASQEHLSFIPVSQVGISCRPRYISWSIPAKFCSSSCLQSSEHLCVCPVQLNLPGTYKRFQCQLKYRNQVEKLCPFQTRPSPEALPKRNFDKSCKNDL